MDSPQAFLIENLPDLRPRIEVIDKEHYIKAGGYGDIRRGHLKLPGSTELEVVAIKVFREVQLQHIPEDVRITNERRHNREMRVWQGLQHRNILPLLGRYTNDGFALRGGLVSPYRDMGNVMEYLEARKESANRLSIIHGAASGLAYLHSKDVIHGDFKPRNILMHSEGGEDIPQVCDFGLSRVIGRESDITKTFAGAYRYTAPEILLNEDKEGTEALSLEGDIYSMGMVILEVLTDLMPFMNKAKETVVILALTKKDRPSRNQYGSNVRLLNECWPLIETCWSESPEKRGKANDVVIFLDRLQWPAEIVNTQG